MEKTVLIVDDSTAIRRILVFNMKKIQGVSNLLEAGNGKEALDQLNNNKVDLILLDINMPVMDGFEFMEHINKNAKIKKIPVVVLTTEGRDDVREKMKAMGVYGYLTKPVQMLKFKKILDELF